MSTLTLASLTNAQRGNLRHQSLWTTCFQSWQDAAKPSSIRRLLAGPKETLLREVDSLTWAVMDYLEKTVSDETQQLAPENVVEALQRMDVLNWDDEATEEEQEAEEPLTDAETEQLEALIPD